MLGIPLDIPVTNLKFNSYANNTTAFLWRPNLNATNAVVFIGFERGGGICNFPIFTPVAEDMLQYISPTLRSHHSQKSPIGSFCHIKALSVGGLESRLFYVLTTVSSSDLARLYWMKHAMAAKTLKCMGMKTETTKWLLRNLMEDICDKIEVQQSVGNIHRMTYKRRIETEPESIHSERSGKRRRVTSG